MRSKQNIMPVRTNGHVVTLMTQMTPFSHQDPHVHYSINFNFVIHSYIYSYVSL